MVCNVEVTRDAEEDLERFIKYLIFEKKSMQAAENVLNDYEYCNEDDVVIVDSIFHELQDYEDKMY